MALLTQRHRDWGCWLVLPPQTSEVAWEWGGSLPGSFRSRALKMRTSADSRHSEGASLESGCSASSAHGTVCTEALTASYLQTFAFSEQSQERRLAGITLFPRMCLKFEVARQGISPSVCVCVRAVPCADEAEQQLSRLATSGCQLSADVRIFGAELKQEIGRQFHHSKATFHI